MREEREGRKRTTHVWCEKRKRAMIALRRGEWLEEVARCVCGQLERAIIVCVVGSRTAKCTLKMNDDLSALGAG